MKKIFIATLFASFALVLASNAGTAKVFVQYLGGNLKTPTEDQQASYAAFLSTNNVDFGVFYGPTSASGFGLTAAGYATEFEYVSGMNKGGRVLVYKTADWRIAQHDEAVNQGTSKYPNWCNAYIVERKSNGEQFYVVMFTGSRFDKGSYLTYGGYLSARANLGPWLLVALPYNGALYTSDSYTSTVASNLSSSYTRAPNASGTGAIFSKKHATLSTSGVSVPQATLGFGGEPDQFVPGFLPFGRNRVLCLARGDRKGNQGRRNVQVLEGSAHGVFSADGSDPQILLGFEGAE